MNSDADTIRQIREHLDALSLLLRRLEPDGKKTDGMFKRGGLTSEQLRALARPPRKETRR